MSYFIIVTGSMTTAARLAKRLKKAGADAQVIGTPQKLKTQEGCSYSVKVSLQYESILKKISGNVNYKGIYIEDVIGGERTYHDIS